jgi:hypothetical protein
LIRQPYVGKTDDINWILQIDEVSEDLEKVLKELGKRLRDWFHHTNGTFADDESDADNLGHQIWSIKTSTGINECVEALERHNLKMLGATYVYWQKDRIFNPVHLVYHSKLKLALSIVPKEKTISVARVFAGWQPPQSFDEKELDGIAVVNVDNQKVWSRVGETKPTRLDELPC